MSDEAVRKIGLAFLIVFQGLFYRGFVFQLKLSSEQNRFEHVDDFFFPMFVHGG